MENRKIWLIADTHFGLKGDDPEWLNDYTGYFEKVVIPLMREEAGENDILVHCGDVFDNRAIIGLDTIDRVIRIFEKFSEIFKDIRITVGNHDCFNKNSTDVTSVNVLKYIPNVKIYYTPMVEVIDGKTVLFNPWVEDVEEERKILNGVSVDYVFGHLEIGGSQVASRTGVKNLFNGGVRISDFKNAQVYAGHFHIRQDNKNIHYVGSPYHKDRGDRDNAKGITVLDIKTGETRFIENTVSPRYMKESIYDLLNMTVEEVAERWNNNRVELHLKNSDLTKCNFDDFKTVLDHCFKSFETKGDDVLVEMTTKNDASFNEAKSSDEYIDEYLDMQDVDPEIRAKVKSVLEGYNDRV